MTSYSFKYGRQNLWMDCRNAGFKTKMCLSKFLFAIKIESEFQKSGTVKGSVMAGIKIIGWIFKYTFK
jgi:hypothetical protein